MLNDLKSLDHEQDLEEEKIFYEEMFSGLKGPEDGHCIVYGHDQIYSAMDMLPRGSVLEVGCGGGHHTVALTKKGFEVTAVDISISALQAAKALAERERQNSLFICGDMKRLPFEANQFDICFCSLILHHFTSMDNVIRELARVTRKYFVAYEVNALDAISFTRFNLINPIFGIKGISKNQRAVFPGRLGGLLARNGFREVSIRYEDVHDSLGKSPESLYAKAILSYQTLLKLFPERYSRNKFLLVSKK
jgi:SAM-dependent methyltransferase